MVLAGGRHVNDTSLALTAHVTGHVVVLAGGEVLAAPRQGDPGGVQAGQARGVPRHCHVMPRH